jgi:hypothetical protein
LPRLTLSYETIRNGCHKFGQRYCKLLKKNRGRLGDTWYLDEVFININGVLHYLWRAVGEDGDEIDILVQKRKDKKASRRFFRKLLKGQQASPGSNVGYIRHPYCVWSVDGKTSFQSVRRHNRGTSLDNSRRFIVAQDFNTMTAHNFGYTVSPALLTKLFRSSTTRFAPYIPWLASYDTLIRFNRRVSSIALSDNSLCSQQ